MPGNQRQHVVLLTEIVFLHGKNESNLFRSACPSFSKRSFVLDQTFASNPHQFPTPSDYGTTRN
jgi:hypothetical protein